MRKSTLMWLLLAAAASTILFHTSQKVTDGRQVLMKMNQSIRKEEESLRVLQAEWSYLNQPERLEKLAGEYLTLQPQKGRQFTQLKDLKNIDPSDLLADSKPAVTETHPAIPAAADEAPQDVSLASPTDEAVTPNNENEEEQSATAPGPATEEQLTIEDTSPVVISTKKPQENGFRSEMQKPKAEEAPDDENEAVDESSAQEEPAGAVAVPVAASLIDLPATPSPSAAKPAAKKEAPAAKAVKAAAPRTGAKPADTKTRDFGDVMKGLSTP